MPCFRLRPAWLKEAKYRKQDLSKGPQPYEYNEGKQITFRKKGSQLDPDYMIPCKKCDGCAAEKAREWAVRMYHESQYHERNSFLTLTYQNLPPGGKINKKHCQDFFKRLRKESPVPIRYFLTGEYGDKTRRPHYHAIIFGEDYRGGAYDIDHVLYANPRLNKIWQHGFVSIGSVSLASCLYVAGYVNKKINDNDTFSLQSTVPPLGYEYAKEHQQILRNRENIVINGQTFPIPEPYFKWFTPSKFRPEVVDIDGIDKRRYLIPKTDEQIRNNEINYKARKALKEEKI